MAEFVKQAEFARMKGMSRGWVTQLKNAGRLVFNDDGLVDVEKSNLLIDQTSDVNRQDVSERHQAAREGNKNQTFDFNNERVGGSLQTARAVKEKYAALQAKAQYEEYIGELVRKNEMESAVSDLVMIFRQSLENIPHMLAPVLVNKDIDYIRASLRDAIESALKELSVKCKKVINERAPE